MKGEAVAATRSHMRGAPLDWKEVGVAVLSGGGVSVLMEFIRLRRENKTESAKELARSIRADEVVREAVEDVAVAAAVKSNEFPSIEKYDHLVDTVHEIRDAVKSGDRKLDRLLMNQARLRVSPSTDPED
jgi:uncharacterized membrane protein YcjF (UPF0283 family)